MAKGQEFSRYQRGVINRYYEHADNIALQRLSEMVSDLYLAEGGKALQLWKSVATSLAKLAPEGDPRVAKVLQEKSVTGLAKLVGELSATAQTSSKKAQGTAGDDLDPTVPSPDVAPLGGTRPSTHPTPQPIAASQAVPSEPEPVTPDQLKAAMKSFRKRLKLTKLDEESKISNRAMTSGRQSAIVAIMAPREYPKAVWDELVREGKLKDVGRGFYELTS